MGVGQEVSKVCPNCMQPVATSAMLCVGCGYHFAQQRVLKTQRVESTGAADDPPLTPQQRMFDQGVRIAGFSLPVLGALATVAVVWQLVATDWLSWDSYSLMVGCLGYVGLLLASVVGVVIGLNGAEFGPEARDVRRRGARYLFAGLAAISLGSFFFLAQILVGAGIFALAFTSIIGCGLVSVLLGLAALGTGRDLGDALGMFFGTDD